MNTSAPPPRFREPRGSRGVRQSTWPRRLVRMVRSKASSGMSTTSLSLPIASIDRSAALAWRMSSPPYSATTSPISADTCSSSAMSTARPNARPPAERIRSATASAAVPSRSATATVHPSSANRTHVAVPIPPAPPATIATLPASPRRAPLPSRPGQAESDTPRASYLRRTGTSRVERTHHGTKPRRQGRTRHRRQCGRNGPLGGGAVRRRGRRVAITARWLDGLQETLARIEEVGGTGLVLQCDLSDPAGGRDRSSRAPKQRSARSMCS